jgi:16S rRNA (guanine966-N2)-methyltransferase
MKNQMGKVRLISGKWRSRLLKFPSVPGLRPTLDRVRVTLFNWLMPHVRDAVCLDLFAGTGALGFEALSRGAAKVTFVESEESLVTALYSNAFLLGADNMEVIHATFPELPVSPEASFDIVFLDPPFGKGLVSLALKWLADSHALKLNALIYIETEKQLALPELPLGWEVIKSSKTSTLNFYLCIRKF